MTLTQKGPKVRILGKTAPTSTVGLKLGCCVYNGLLVVEEEGETL